MNKTNFIIMVLNTNCKIFVINMAILKKKIFMHFKKKSLN